MDGSPWGKIVLGVRVELGIFLMHTGSLNATHDWFFFFCEYSYRVLCNTEETGREQNTLQGRDALGTVTGHVQKLRSFRIRSSCLVRSFVDMMRLYIHAYRTIVRGKTNHAPQRNVDSNRPLANTDQAPTSRSEEHTHGH